jgi:hypothetical protein
MATIRIEMDYFLEHRREGEAVILEPVKPSSWPPGFFVRIRIDEPAFTRPEQGQ